MATITEIDNLEEILSVKIRKNMTLFAKNPNESACVGDKKHWSDVIKNSVRIILKMI